jgi:hypothetical protein
LFIFDLTQDIYAASCFQVGKETTVFIPPETLLERASVAALAESRGDQPQVSTGSEDVPLGLGFEIAGAFGIRNQVADGPEVGDLFMATIGFLERKLFTDVFDRFVIGGGYDDLMALKDACNL